MATPVGVAVATFFKILAETSASAALNNPLERRQTLTPGTVYVGGVLAIAGKVFNSNQSYTVSAGEVHIAHNLLDPRDEAAYTSNALLLDQEIMMNPSWWREIAGVYEVISGPTVETQEREGNVIRYVVLVDYSIVPE
jgi:hypothetical protein